MCQLFPFRHLSFSPIDTPSVGCVYFSREIIGLPSPHTDGFARPVRRHRVRSHVCCACEFSVEWNRNFHLYPCRSQVPLLFLLLFVLYLLSHPISASETYTSFWSSVSVERDCHLSASLFVVVSSHLIRPPPPLLGSMRSFCTNVHGTGESEIPNRVKSVMVYHLRIHGVHSFALCWVRDASPLLSIVSLLRSNSTPQDSGVRQLPAPTNGRWIAKRQ